MIEALEGRYGDDVELCHASGLNLLGCLRGQELMIVVDACIAGREPGSVWAQEPELERETVRETSVHQIGPVEALVVARHLYPDDLPRRVLLLLVETEALDEAREASATEQVIDFIDREVAAWRSRRPGTAISAQHQRGGPS